MALKKAVFKPAAFFKGIILPLAQDSTSREALIVGSILQKISIPILHASAAILKLSEYEYSIGSGFFMKILLSKNYSLPTKVIDSLVTYFCNFGLDKEDDEEEEGKDQM